MMLDIDDDPMAEIKQKLLGNLDDHKTFHIKRNADFEEI